MQPLLRSKSDCEKIFVKNFPLIKNQGVQTERPFLLRLKFPVRTASILLLQSKSDCEKIFVKNFPLIKNQGVQTERPFLLRLKFPVRPNDLFNTKVTPHQPYKIPHKKGRSPRTTNKTTAATIKMTAVKLFK